MIKYSISIAGNVCGIEIDGHAGYAEAGQDIVCAGMSMLAYALAESLRRTGELQVMHEQAGHMELRFKRTRKSLWRLDVFRAGAQLLREQYPEHVQLSRGD